jgi:hypothetical protein
VMHDSLDPRDTEREPVAESRPASAAEAASGDREVPLPGTEIPTAVHAYLDGDSVSQTALTGAERELELWKRITSDLGKRKRMVTPAHVPAQILAKLADD